VKQIELEPKPIPVDEEAGAAEPEGLSVQEAEAGVLRRVLRPQTVVSFLFSFAILVFFITRINIDAGEVAARMSTANPALLLLAFLAYYLSFPVRAFRWRMLLGNAGLSQSDNRRMPGVPGLTEMIFVSWFANCIVPAKLGDAYRSYMLKSRARVSFSTTIGTILTERITDVLVLFGLLIVAGLIAFRGHLPDQLFYLLIFGGVLAAAVIVGLLSLRGLRPLAARLLPERLHDVYSKFEQGIMRSFRPRTLPLLLGYTAVVWVLEGLRLYFVSAALGIRLPLSVTLFIALASSLLTTIPFTPAGLGFVESAVVTALLWFRIDSATAISISFLDRIISYWSIIVFGLIVYVVSANRERLLGLVRRPPAAGHARES
jgi:glycosyltransferase 2 family protein